jgi:glycosyltransferase involved in cell wall biosynthesis
MRIAMVINTSWNIYNFRLGLVQHLRAQGHELFFLAPRDSYTDKIILQGDGYYELKMQNTGSNPIKDLSLIYQFLRIYRKLKPDIILNYTIKPNIYGSFAGRLLGIPLINNVSGLGTVFTHHTFTSKVAKWLYRVAFKGKMVVFFQNADDRKEFLQAVPIKVPTAVIPGSGINTKELLPDPNYSGNGDRFLMVSRLLVDKGVHEYVEAAEKVLQDYPFAKFYLAGDADPSHVRGISIEFIKEKHNKGIIHYLGHSNDIYAEMKKVDWIVLPSYREGTSQVLLEAAALAKPLITTDVPGCNHVVEHGVNGLLFKVKDSDDLAEKIMTAIKMTNEERLFLGNNSRDIAVDKFDESIIFNAYSATISNLTTKD